MRLLGGIASFVGGVLGFALVALFFYLIYATIAWSWGLLLSAAAVTLLGLILLGVGLSADETKARRVKRGEATVLSRLTLSALAQAGIGLSTATFAVAVGLLLTAIFQGLVLSGGPDVFARRGLMEFEESLLWAKLWLDRVLGLDVLAAVLVSAVALSLVLPLKSLVKGTLSARSALSFVYLVLVTITSFTFFAGMALQPYELALREQLRVKAASAFDRQHLDARKSLVAVAWIVEELEDPGPEPLTPDLAARLAEYFARKPYSGEISTAAWRIAGYETVLYFHEEGTRRQERQARELEILAEDAAAVIEPAPAFQWLRAAATSVFGDTFASLKAERGVGALAYARVLHDIDPTGEGWVESKGAPLTQARIAAIELLTGLVVEKIGGGVTNELARTFVGELVQAVLVPLWDVVLPLEVKDVDFRAQVPRRPKARPRCIARLVEARRIAGDTC